MGSANGNAGDPFADFESTEDAETGNGHDSIWREVGAACPLNLMEHQKWNQMTVS